jgi:hypothetical protein
VPRNPDLRQPPPEQAAIADLVVTNPPRFTSTQAASARIFLATGK